MSKNAVRRLQKLHNELKSVISIYDAASSSLADLQVTHGLHGKAQQATGRNFSTKKPGSAPSCSSTSTGSYRDADYSLDTSHRVRQFLQAEFGKDILSTEAHGLFEAGVPDKYGLLLSPSKSLEAAKKVLELNNYYSRDEVSENEQSVFYENFEGIRGSESSSNYAQKQGRIQKSGKKVSTSATDELIAGDFDQSNTPKYLSCSKKKENCKAISVPASRRPVTVKSCPEPQQEILYFGKTYTRHDIPKKIPRLEKHRQPHYTIAHRTVCPERSNLEGNNLNRSRWNEGASGRSRGRSESKDTIRINRSDTRRHGSEDGYRKNLDLEKLMKTQQLESTEFEANELSKIIEKSQEKLEKMEVSKNLAIDIAKQLVSKYDEIKNSKNKLIDRLQMVEQDNERLSNEIKWERDTKVKLEHNMEELKVESKTKLQERERKTKEVLEENVSLRERIKELERQHAEELIEKQKETDHALKKRFTERSTELGKLLHQKCTVELQKRNEMEEHNCVNRKEKDDTSSKIKERAGKSSREIKEMRRDEEVQRLTTENSELIKKIEELSRLLSDKQSRVQSLETKMVDLEEEVRSQRHSLREKTERLEDTNKELDSIRRNSKELEEQVKLLRQSIESFDQLHQNLIGKTTDYENQIRNLQGELKHFDENNTKLRGELENEKDALLIKNKIIDDQQETIKQLREKAEEVKTLMKKNESLERMINIERDEKLELQDAVERLKWRKDELKKKIKSLEGDLLLAPQEVVRDLQKTQMVLHELENQVQLKQKEWELHLQSLIKEKEQACSVAEFATKKLVQTTNEFHKQSEAHKRLHKVLAENLAEKERYLREINEKMNQSCYESILADVEKEKLKRREIGVDEWQSTQHGSLLVNRYLNLNTEIQDLSRLNDR